MVIAFQWPSLMVMAIARSSIASPIRLVSIVIIPAPTEAEF